MKRTKLVFAIGALCVIIGSGCKWTNEAFSAPAPQVQPSVNKRPPGSNGSLSGKVVETMNSGGYTYVSLENNGKKTWVAIPQTAVKVGQNVTCQPGMVMQNFTSKTMNRTFDSIVFSGGIILISADPGRCIPKAAEFSSAAFFLHLNN